MYEMHDRPVHQVSVDVPSKVYFEIITSNVGELSGGNDTKHVVALLSDRNRPTWLLKNLILAV